MAEEIKWEVTGGTKAGTKIDVATGKLDVDVEEPVETKLTVKASATVEGKELTGTATATVVAP